MNRFYILDLKKFEQEIIETDIALDTNKLKQQGFKCKVKNLEQIINNLQ